MNVITEYNKAKANLFAHFKYDGIDFGIEDLTNDYWKVDNRDIMWSDKAWNEDEDDFEEYSEEVRNIYRTDDLTMIIIYDCAGNQYLAVFDNSKEIK